MKMNKYFAMTFAALAFCACSNDEVPGKDGPDSGKPGEPTYAYFSMKINGEASTKATDAGSAEEQKVTDAVLIICKNLISDKSVEDVIYVDDLGTDTPYPAPKKAVLTTSGDKKVYVVLNPKESTKEELMSMKGGKSQTDVENYKIHLGEAGNLANSHGATPAGKPGSWTLDNLSNLPATIGSRTIMSGAVTVTLEGNKTQDDPNKVAILVDRSVGKAEVGFKDANVLKVANETKTILTLSDPFFAIRNLPVDEYIIQKKQAVTNYVMAPGFALSTSDEFDAAFDEVAPINGAVSIGGAPASDIRYISENSNQTPMRGNTSYAIVKTTFQLEDKTVATSYTPGTDGMRGGALTLNQGEFTTGLLMYTGTEFFEASKDGAFNAEAAINRWAAYTISIANTEDGAISETPSAVAPTDPANAKKISGTIYASDEELMEAVDGNAAYGYALVRVKADGIETVVDYIQIYKFRGTATNDNFEQYKMGDPIQASFYKAPTCYYRVNIVDKAYPQPSSMFYSVLRNNWYKLNITKVTSIGYPNEDDVTVKPTDPLGANTHIQAEITVKPWNIVDGDYEIGM